MRYSGSESARRFARFSLGKDTAAFVSCASLKGTDIRLCTAVQYPLSSVVASYIIHISPSVQCHACDQIVTTEAGEASLLRTGAYC